MSDSVGGVRNAPLVSGIVVAWSAIRLMHPDVPEIMISMSNRTYRKRPIHAAASLTLPAYVGEPATLWISENAQRTYTGQEMMGLLLHEACHGMAHTRSILDCSNAGRHHNLRFRELAAEAGLMLGSGRAEHEGPATLNPIASIHYRQQVLLLDSAGLTMNPEL